MNKEARYHIVESDSSSTGQRNGEQMDVQKTGKKKIPKIMKEKGVKTGEVDIKEVLEISKTLQKRMKDILERDNKNNREGNPAIEKIGNVDEISNLLMNKSLQECLLDEGILSEIRGWLEPLPDKSMPNIKVKKRLLEVLKSMKVHKEHLISSGIGKIVYFYSLNYKETREIRNAAKQLVRKWTSEAFRPDEEY